MSSMRNAAPRRPHRERAQPQARSKWGLLEKHKDYSLRAADYNRKKKKLGILSQKTREKNPDEFAFGMLSADKAKAGKHGRGDGIKNRLDHAVVEKLKEQDAGYLRTVLSRNRKELDKVKEEIGLDSVMKNRGISAAKKENQRKINFNEDDQPATKKRKLTSTDVNEAGSSDGEEDNDDFHSALDGNEGVQADLVTIHEPLPLNQNISSSGFDDDDDDDDETSQPKTKTKKQLLGEANALLRHKMEKRRRKKIREARATKLEILKKRQRSIIAAANELELQRARMAKTIGGTNRNGVKFKVRERKR